MRTNLQKEGYTIFIENPKYLSLKAKTPITNEVADFTLCRNESNSTFTISNIIDDLARRDFTINAIAKTFSGEYIDPFNGINDLKIKRLKTVGKAIDRFNEDPLRIIRAIRFAITLDLIMDEEIIEILKCNGMVDKLRVISVDRIRQELHKMFTYDTIKSINFISQYLHIDVQEIIFSQIWLKPTTENKKKN